MIKIMGFSLFCDYENVNSEKMGGINIKRLREEYETIYRKQDRPENTYFQEILKNEFEDVSRKSLIKNDKTFKHRYLMDNFEVEIKLSMNKKDSDPTQRGEADAPFMDCKVHIGDEDNCIDFRLFQPQLLRISKTLEIIGFYNEFKDAVVLGFKNVNLEEDEIEKYLDDYYVPWRMIKDTKDKL